MKNPKKDGKRGMGSAETGYDPKKDEDRGRDQKKDKARMRSVYNCGEVKPITSVPALFTSHARQHPGEKEKVVGKQRSTRDVEGAEAKVKEVGKNSGRGEAEDPKGNVQAADTMSMGRGCEKRKNQMDIVMNCEATQPVRCDARDGSTAYQEARQPVPQDDTKSS